MTNALKLIESFPRGRTTGDLLRLRDIDLLPRERLEFLRNLEALAREGLIELGKDGKWRAKSRCSADQPLNPSSPSEGDTITLGDPLFAAPARLLQVSVPIAEIDIEDGIDVNEEKPDPQALIRYYRSALRSDPRGALIQSPDRHTTSFQLITGNGKWWGEQDLCGEIHLRLDQLPPDFREALIRRQANENSLAVGWPIAIGRKSGVTAIWPVGLLAAEWRREDNSLVITIESDNILVNPDWLKAAARGTAWSEAALRDVFSITRTTALPREDFKQRLNEAMARSIRGTLQGVQPLSTLELTSEGIHDAVALFLPTDSTFTAGAVRDLDQIAAWSSELLSQTALGTVLGLNIGVPTNIAPTLNIGPLNAEQISSVQSAMKEPLTVVTGPPGTGKSQAIMAMVASALAAGQKVLVASKNHQALDAVEDRLSAIAPEANFMVRTLNPAKEVDVGFRQVLDTLVRDPSGLSQNPDAALAASLQIMSEERQDLLELIEERRHLNLQLAEHIERRDAISVTSKQQLSTTATLDNRRSWLSRLLELFIDRKDEPEHEIIPIGANLHSLDVAIARDRERLGKLSNPADPVALTNRIADMSCKYLPHLLNNVATVAEGNRLELTNQLRDIELTGTNSLDRELLEQVLEHRPLWLASILGTPKRIDLYDGLFDLVIFDEASQCDIASALPLLARGCRAVVVGDDRQLAFIPQIGAAQDRNLMAAQGLPRKGMGRFAQGRVSLFDFARSIPNVPAFLLRDQYRSASGIVEYINANFYGGRLRISADLGGLKVPKGERPGIVWTDVPGNTHAGNIGNTNSAEVDAIRAHLRTLLVEQDYDGSIGVIAPFRTQVHAIEKALGESLSADLIDRAELRVATVDGFQGQERDVILFSPTVYAGSPQSGAIFLQREWRRMNVAVSRARAVAHIFGDLSYARSGKIKALVKLASHATEPPRRQGEGIFDSEWERIVDQKLRHRGLDPKPQYEIAGRRLDFALFGASGLKIDLEIDGRMFHQDIDGNRKMDDHWRDHQMRSLGWKVRRFWVDELKLNMEQCLDIVEKDLNQ